MAEVCIWRSAEHRLEAEEAEEEAHDEEEAQEASLTPPLYHTVNDVHPTCHKHYSLKDCVDDDGDVFHVILDSEK